MGGKRTAIRERYGRLDVGYMTIKAAFLVQLNVLLLVYSSVPSSSKRQIPQIHIPCIAYDQTENIQFIHYSVHQWQRDPKFQGQICLGPRTKVLCQNFTTLNVMNQKMQWMEILKSFFFAQIFCQGFNGRGPH